MITMIPTKDVLVLLFATVATIVATITGLIGEFSTFRLQNINREVNLLKDIVIHKKAFDKETILDLIKANNYNLLEKVYDRNLAGANLLKEIIVEGGFIENKNELLIDTDNITRNQLLHDNIKGLTIRGFTTSLIFVFLSLQLLVLTNFLIMLNQYLWFMLIVYLFLTSYIFFLFVNQLKKMIG